jgi:CDP-paratose synthetase
MTTTGNDVIDSIATNSCLAGAHTFAITGATGYLGSHLARRLHQCGHRVVVLKRSQSNVSRIADILAESVSYDIDVQPFDAIFKEQRITCILHCATDYGRKDVSRASIIEANLLLPLRLLETAIQHGTPFFVNTDTVLDKRVSAYSLSKRQFRDWLATLSTSIHGINVALEHFYGPGDDASKFVGEMVRRLLAGDPRIALTPGEQQRDFVYIDDVVDAFTLILAHHMNPLRPAGPSRPSPTSLDCYEIGSGRPVSIREFMTSLRRLSGQDHIVLGFGAIPYRDNEVMYSQARIGPLLSLGWKPRVSLEDGLRRTIASERSRILGEYQCDT